MADRFWVGNGGNWSDNANHWSASSGGSPGASLPTSADNVYFDANSFTAEGQTVTINATANCLDMDWTGATNSPTLEGSAQLYIYGSLNLGTITRTFTGNIFMKATSSGKTITTNGITFASIINFSGIGGEWTLQDNLTNSNNITLTAGTLNTNGKNISCATFTGSGTTPRVLQLGASVITCSDLWTFTTTTGLTFDAGTSTIIMTGNTKTFAGGGLTYNNVEFQGTPITVTGSNIFSNLKLTAGGIVNFTAGTTQTVTTWYGDGAVGNLITIQSTVAGSAFTISKSSGTVIKNYYLIRDSIVTGGATFVAINSINISGNSGWAWNLVNNNVGALGFTFNSIHSRTYGIVAKTINRPLLPSLRKRELIIPGRHGAYDFSDNTYENRIIEVELKYIGTSFTELRTRARTIAAWLSGYNGSKNLVFDDEPDKYYVGKIYSAVGLQSLFTIGQCTIQFECEPFAYANLEEYDVTYNYDTGLQYDSGLIYPNQRTVYDWYFLAPFFNVRSPDSREWCGFAWSYNPHMTSLYNHGTIKTPFTMTIYGKVENPRIAHEQTTASITISANMTASTLIINSEDYTVTLDGVNYLSKMTGDFFDLEVGANGFFFYGANPKAEVTFSWDHRWL